MENNLGAVIWGTIQWQSEQDSGNNVNSAVFRLHRNGRIVKVKAEQCLNPWQPFQVEVEVTLELVRWSPISPSRQFFPSLLLLSLSPLHHCNPNAMVWLVLTHERRLKFSITLVAWNWPWWEKLPPFITEIGKYSNQCCFPKNQLFNIYQHTTDLGVFEI